MNFLKLLLALLLLGFSDVSRLRQNGLPIHDLSPPCLWTGSLGSTSDHLWSMAVHHQGMAHEHQLFSKELLMLPTASRAQQVMGPHSRHRVHKGQHDPLRNLFQAHCCSTDSGIALLLRPSLVNS